MVMSVAAATVISMLSVATSAASMGVAVATYRRNRPRVRVGIDDFFYITSPMRGPVRGQSRLQVSYVVANTGDRPVRVTDAVFTALVPWTALPESAATTPLVGEDGTPDAGRVLGHPRRVRWTDRLPVTSRWSRDSGDKMAIRLYAETASEEPGGVARLRQVFAHLLIGTPPRPTKVTASCSSPAAVGRTHRRHNKHQPWSGGYGRWSTGPGGCLDFGCGGRVDRCVCAQSGQRSVAPQTGHQCDARLKVSRPAANPTISAIMMPTTIRYAMAHCRCAAGTTGRLPGRPRTRRPRTRRPGISGPGP
jgi:hypothetical protein